jgi:hypothetical protein
MIKNKEIVELWNNTPESILVLNHLNTNSYNLFARIRIDQYRNTDYRDTITHFWNDSSIINLYYIIEGNRGSRQADGFHLHLLVESSDLVETASTLRSLATKELSQIESNHFMKDKEVYLKPINSSEDAKVYLTKFIGNEGIGWDKLLYGFYVRYQNFHNGYQLHDELFQQDKFFRREIVAMSGRMDRTFYRAKNKYNLKESEVEEGGRGTKLYKRSDVIQFFEQMGIIKPSKNQPVDRYKAYNDYARVGSPSKEVIR